MAKNTYIINFFLITIQFSLYLAFFFSLLPFFFFCFLSSLALSFSIFYSSIFDTLPVVNSFIFFHNKKTILNRLKIYYSLKAFFLYMLGALFYVSSKSIFLMIFEVFNYFSSPHLLYINIDYNDLFFFFVNLYFYSDYSIVIILLVISRIALAIVNLIYKHDRLIMIIDDTYKNHSLKFSFFIESKKLEYTFFGLGLTLSFFILPMYLITHLIKERNLKRNYDKWFRNAMIKHDELNMLYYDIFKSTSVAGILWLPFIDMHNYGHFIFAMISLLPLFTITCIIILNLVSYTNILKTIISYVFSLSLITLGFLHLVDSSMNPFFYFIYNNIHFIIRDNHYIFSILFIFMNTFFVFVYFFAGLGYFIEKRLEHNFYRSPVYQYFFYKSSYFYTSIITRLLLLVVYVLIHSIEANSHLDQYIRFSMVLFSLTGVILIQDSNQSSYLDNLRRKYSISVIQKSCKEMEDKIAFFYRLRDYFNIGFIFLIFMISFHTGNSLLILLTFFTTIFVLWIYLYLQVIESTSEQILLDLNIRRLLLNKKSINIVTLGLLPLIKKEINNLSK